MSRAFGVDLQGISYDFLLAVGGIVLRLHRKKTCKWNVRTVHCTLSTACTM
ncbi:hypothetical protein CAter282_0404 [Collimonas arenae]|uniref:Uncharacterized protein n=1 Tax=Collimonas arenae TaxID=279058 RepID=A0A127PKK5_9BURK|nr:hypothetical protein CAter10_0432 [Collimonas arenae]AMP08220.1 hypothetical protein CAter282_0404 [Collimonas arenae]